MATKPFVYTPDYNDPELSLLRRRALDDIGRGRSRISDEIGRSGLLGSSAGFAQLDEFERGSRGYLGDIDDRVFARQRADALDLYRDELAYERQRKLMDEQNSGFRLGALAEIGSAFIPGIGGVGRTASSMFRNKNLPRASLQAASEIPYDLPDPRLRYL
jgi:hypothetical protein